MKHCASGIDSLQTKANIADSLLKELNQNQVEHKATVDKLTSVINNLVERVDMLESKQSRKSKPA